MRSPIAGMCVVGFLLVGCDDTPEPGWVGLSHTYVKQEDTKRLELKKKAGARITKIAEDGPADKAGLQVDDVIFAFHGKMIVGPVEFAKQIETVLAGQEFSIAVYRKGKVVELTIVTVPRPE